MKRTLVCLLVSLWVAHGATAAETTPATAGKKAGLDFFETKIRPVLVEHCYQCHSAGAAAKKKLKGELLLDTRVGIRKGGETGPAVVPDKVEESLLITALKYESIEMPPSGKLSDAIIADFVQWVNIGAPDPRTGEAAVRPVAEIDIEAGRRLWSFQPLKQARPPDVDDTSWGRTPIDRFIRAKQEQAGITPNGVTDPQTLIRRAYYDLTGLPPAPEEVEHFVTAAQEDLQVAYDALIVRLLSSGHYGERWARHWLDVVRFAESYGYAFDKDRPHAYQYRDFVIRALNADMPYDKFVYLQIAGDLLPEAQAETAAEVDTAVQTIAATGYLVFGPFTTQQTAKERERSRYEQLDDMVHTLGTSMLGLTLGCSRCHSHKYDPLPIDDYYQLASCFADVGFENTGINRKPEDYKEKKAKYDAVHDPLLASRTNFEKEHLNDRFDAWFQNRSELPPSPDVQAWHHIGPFTAEGFDQTFDKAFPPEEGIDLEKSYDDGKLKWKERPRWKDGRVHKTLEGKNAANYLFRVIESPVAQEVDLSLGSDDAVKLWLNGIEILAKKVKRGVAANQEKVQLGLQKGRNELLVKIAHVEEPAGFYSKAASERPPAEVAELLKSQREEWNDEQRKQVLDWYKTQDAVWLNLNVAIDAYRTQEPKPDLAMVYAAKVRGTTYQFGDDTYKVYHLRRGNPDNRASEATPGFLQVLIRAGHGEQHWLDARADEQGSPAKPARIALADWLTDVDHGAGHLLARVIVNRLWHHHFGRGIVATCNDFGTRGEPPTHPELLDWLAVELIRSGWRLKPLHRLIMTSSVYMQAGEATQDGPENDPGNLLWWRRPARRVEAEIIRDALLAVCGTLDRKMYGSSTLEQETPRRSIYLTVKRSQLIPLLQLFDAPDAMQGIGSRQESTVAPQALALLNSPMIRGLATKFAARVRAAKTPADGIPLAESVDRAYRIALSRSPSGEELAAMEAFIQSQKESRGKEEDTANLAFRDFCHLMLCMNEFVYVD